MPGKIFLAVPSSGSGGGGSINGGGTANFVSKFTGATNIGNSLLTDDGTTIGVNAPLALGTWSTAGRPAGAAAGTIGWNTDLLRFDHYTGAGGWKNFVRLDGDTMTGILTGTSLIMSPAANTAAFALTGYSLTGNNAQSVFDLAGTWNTTGTPTALKLNITDTASNAASLFVDLQIGGTSKFKVDKSGVVSSQYFYSITGGSSTPTYSFTSETNSGLFRNSAGVISLTALGVVSANFGRNVANTGTAIAPAGSSSGTDIGDSSSAGAGRYFNNINCYSWLTAWASTTSTTASIRLGCSADGVGIFTNAAAGATQVLFALEAANQFAFRNSTNAQSFYVYNTYTSGANFERGVFDWSTSANVLTIGAKTTGGTQRAVNFDAASYAFQIAGSPVLQLGGGNLNPYSDGGLNLGTTSSRYNGGYFKSTAQILGASSTFEVWNTDSISVPTNWEKGVFSWAANVLSIGAKNNGTGTQRAVNFDAASYAFQVAGTTAANLSSTQIYPQTDGGIDIGSGATTTDKRFNNGYFKTSVKVTGAVSTIQVHNLAYDGTNGEWFEALWISNACYIGTNKSGSGGTRALTVRVGGTNVASFGSSALAMTSGLTTSASTTTRTGFNIPSGTAPTSPVSGDMWFDGTNVLFRVGGTTKTFTLV
jgi:hypothetical protein